MSIFQQTRIFLCSFPCHKPTCLNCESLDIDIKIGSPKNILCFVKKSQNRNSANVLLVELVFRGKKTGKVTR